MLISLYTTRVVLNALGVVDFGIYNVVCGFVAMFSFLNTTMSNGIQRFYNYEAGKNGIESVAKIYRDCNIDSVTAGVVDTVSDRTIGNLVYQ